MAILIPPLHLWLSYKLDKISAFVYLHYMEGFVYRKITAAHRNGQGHYISARYFFVFAENVISLKKKKNAITTTKDS